MVASFGVIGATKPEASKRCKVKPPVWISCPDRCERQATAVAAHPLRRATQPRHALGGGHNRPSVSRCFAPAAWPNRSMTGSSAVVVRQDVKQGLDLPSVGRLNVTVNDSSSVEIWTWLQSHYDAPTMANSPLNHPGQP